MWVSASLLFRSLSADVCAFLGLLSLELPVMNKLVSALLVVVLCIMGAILFYLPWTGIWEKNYFLAHYPSLMRILLHPSFRGVVSGLGVLDIFLAITMIGSDTNPSTPSRVPRQ
jgi:hypothetical protein